jgi:predicted AAA+ superfamily ATPase
LARGISARLLDVARQFPCVVLTGARQVGKTTLLKRLFPDHRFVSLDLPSLAEQADEEPDFFLRHNPPPLVIDEVQYAPKLFRHLKAAIDRDRHVPGQFILTGSQKFVLMKEVSDSLAGRAAILSLDNLSLSELRLQPDADWLNVLTRGFYPELWRQPDLDSHAFYSSYLASYLERDVRQILNVHSLRDFERFLRACAARSGQLLNMSDLARDVGIKSQTARDWLSVLDASNQISLLEPYFENVGKRIVKSPKLFLNDPGMLCYLLALDAGALASTPLVGMVWETFIFAEFRKQMMMSNRPSSLWFYRDGQGREIDFLRVGGGKIDLIESKWTENPDDRWVDGLNLIGKVLEGSRTQGVGNKTLLCRATIPTLVRSVKVTHPAAYFGGAESAARGETGS